MVKVGIDPEFRSLIPPLGQEELSQLESNLVLDGCRDALVMWRGILLDGHNRKEICERRGIKYRVVEIELDDREAAKIWIIDNQFGRRNLPDIDRIDLARKREGIVREKAKASYDDNVGRPPKEGKSSAKLRSNSPPKSKVKTSRESAKVAGVGERTYDAGKMVLDAAEKGEIPQETVEKVRRKEKSIHAVAKEIKESRRKAKGEESRKKAAEAGVTHESIIVGDFRAHADRIADGSLSLIFTDPPYDRDAIQLYDGLGEFAASKLHDGGSLLCYVGQIQLFEAMAALRKHLRQWWTCCCLHSEGDTIMREYGIRNRWKAVLWFVKDYREDTSAVVLDVMSGGKEKSHHNWQQAESEAAYWIEKLCPTTGIVCDPFLGGGTTAAAANSLGRKWIGFEINADHAAIASGRVS